MLDLLEAGTFAEVADEFNAKMAAAMPVSRLRDMWTTVSRQAGARTSIIRQQVVTQATGNVTAVNVCQFEKTALAGFCALRGDVSSGRGSHTHRSMGRVSLRSTRLLLTRPWVAARY